MNLTSYTVASASEPALGAPGRMTVGGSLTMTWRDSDLSPMTTITWVTPGPRPTSVTSPSCAAAPTRDGSRENAAVAPSIFRVTVCWYWRVSGCATASLPANASAPIRSALIAVARRYHDVDGSREYLFLIFHG